MMKQANCKKKSWLLKRSFLTIIFLFGGYMYSTAQNQKVQVSGVVTSLSDKLPLPGVSIVDVSDPKNGVVADFDGKYTIAINNGNTTLRFTMVGFKSVEVKVNNKSIVNASMDLNVSSLDAVVVVGYGTQKKATVTGAVSAVKGDELAKQHAVNLTSSLAGRVPGLFVSQSGSEPGYDNANIRIRGTNTYNNSAPLVVIDGIPDRAGGLSRLNPSDIKDISVLKDASAAIYGARAANGVILVTTKKGKTGKPQLSYSYNYGLGKPTSLPELADAAQYAELRNELEIYNLPVGEWQGANTGFKTTGTYTRPDGSIRNAPFTQEDITLYKNGQDPWGHPNTDWYDATFKKVTPQAKHNLQLTGGSDNFSYFTSLGYLNQDAYYKNSATGYKQYDFRVNLDAKITPFVKLSLGMVAREEFRFFPTQGSGDIFRMLTRGRPTEQAYWPNGLPGPDIEFGQNPVVITTNQTGYDRDTRDYFQSNATLDFTIPGVKGLGFQTTAAIDKNFRNVKTWRTPWFLYSWDGTTVGADGLPSLLKGQRGPAEPNLNQGTNNTLNILLGANATYKRNFGDHNFMLLAGVNKETAKYEGFNAYRRYFISPTLDDLFAGGDLDKDNSGSSNESARLNYYGRANYSYKEKYIVEFLFRYDGSYLFPEETRYGFFPGVSAGWVISKEKFFSENVPFVNFLKFKGSWGQLGNDKFNDDDYPSNQYLATYGFGNYIINNTKVTTINETKVPNTDITWEVATNTNIGIEAKFLDSKINFEFDVFVNKRTDILTTPSASLPGLSGITPPRQNFGEVENKGFDFILGYADRKGDFGYNVSVNGGYAKNKIIFNDEAQGAPQWQKETGQPIRSNLVYGYDGVFATQADIDAETLDYSALVNVLRPGDMKFKDYNGDGKITPDDRYRTGKNSDPRFQAGLNLSLTYKNFDLGVMFQGAAGGEVFLNFGETGTVGNYPLDIYEKRWSSDNPSDKYPRITDRGDQYYSRGNTYWRQNTDYIRLKNLELGFTIPKNMISKIGLENFRLYVSGSNLITMTNSLFDPEGVNDSGRDYPNSMIINTGFTLTF
ncbi:SusC/RagA family TonB-linked outer membrane protein [Flavobacterium sp. ZS1P14]|uniref:SusC/RagA family TonB-linked outer membrane protein n=1 Tax=Flavobacterium sp. ZS1P14 TaxID=3401729 RepID=UPI003AAFB902